MWRSCITIGLLISIFLTGCGENQKKVETKQTNDVSDLNWQMPDFTYTDQEGKPFGMKNLKGKIWMADFVFTRCPNICPPMTRNMANLQKNLQKEGIQLEVVSFDVDPDYDKPSVLKKFAKEHGADLSRWHFLTGYSMKEVQDLAKNTFKNEVMEQESSSSARLIGHPSYFYLMDKNGKVVKFYDGVKPVDAKQVKKDILDIN